MKYIFTILISFSFVSIVSSEEINSQINLERNKYNYHEDKRISCNKLLEVMRGSSCCEKFFKNGNPVCRGEEFPEEWIVKKIKINQYAYTECGIPCNVRQFPLLGPYNGNELFGIRGTQKIFLKDEITIADSNIRHEPWHNIWYSFLYKNKTYYISKLNIKK